MSWCYESSTVLWHEYPSAAEVEILGACRYVLEPPRRPKSYPHPHPLKKRGGGGIGSPTHEGTNIYPENVILTSGEISKSELSVECQTTRVIQILPTPPLKMKTVPTYMGPTPRRGGDGRN